jgi:hypothetical protein
MVLRSLAIRAAWGYLALVLLLAPVLGLMHGLVHGAGDKRQAAHARLAADPGQAHAQGWLDDLFSAHGKASDCRVYDQLGHSDALAALPLLALPLLLSPFVFHFLEGEVLARRAALFEARGPPLAR